MPRKQRQSVALATEDHPESKPRPSYHTADHPVDVLRELRARFEPFAKYGHAIRGVHQLNAHPAPACTTTPATTSTKGSRSHSSSSVPNSRSPSAWSPPGTKRRKAWYEAQKVRRAGAA